MAIVLVQSASNFTNNAGATNAVTATMPGAMNAGNILVALGLIGGSPGISAWHLGATWSQFAGVASQNNQLGTNPSGTQVSYDASASGGDCEIAVAEWSGVTSMQDINLVTNSGTNTSPVSAVYSTNIANDLIIARLRVATNGITISGITAGWTMLFQVDNGAATNPRTLGYFYWIPNAVQTNQTFGCTVSASGSSWNVDLVALQGAAGGPVGPIYWSA